MTKGVIWVLVGAAVVLPGCSSSSSDAAGLDEFCSGFRGVIDANRGLMDEYGDAAADWSRITLALEAWLTGPVPEVIAEPFDLYGRAMLGGSSDDSDWEDAYAEVIDYAEDNCPLAGDGESSRDASVVS